VSTSAHPTGTVTFLFTDIEGSTSRWESHREAMQRALRAHDAILAGTIAEHRGYVFKTIGDAFCAAFSDPMDAVRAAIAIQREIASQEWHEIGGLRVRMAIHAGETDERNGDYFGPPVNRVARLLGAGHGGQILVSGAVSDLIAPHLGDGVEAHHLGTLPLRDLKEPERVHQLAAPEMPHVVKALKALETPPNNLPRQTSAFIGRDDDAMRVAEALRSNALVTIVGAGGIGKTRLALEVAATLLNESSDGAWFVDLAAVSDPALVAGTILAEIGAPPSGGGSAAEQLTAYLSRRSLLLVLDNCEHLVDEVASIAGGILARCHETAVVATSREALAIGGEYVYHLATLDASSAIRLFADRAKAANPRFALGDDNRAAVGEICARLDGIALGIELAAARVRTMLVADIAKHLQGRMQSLSGRGRNARQQTMNALVGWSYELLNEEEKKLFRSLAVFAGGMTIESVTAMHADGDIDEWTIVDLLSSLAEKSLLVAEPPEAPVRYRMLEPIREYARERLKETTEIAEAQKRHGRAFAEISSGSYREFEAGPARDWLARQKLELDNFRAAMRWALEGTDNVEIGAQIAGNVGPVFMRLTLLREGVRWGELALQGASSLPPLVGARLNYSLSMLHNNLVSYGAALDHSQKAVDLYRAAADERSTSLALSQVAQQLANTGDTRAAIEIAEEALTRARGIAGDSLLLAAVLSRCANVVDSADFEKSRERYRESAALFLAGGRETEAARVFAWWADTEAVQGNYSEAARLLDESMRTASPEMKMWLTCSAASIHFTLEDRERAISFARRAIALIEEAKHAYQLSSMVSLIAAFAKEDDPLEAVRLLAYADERQRIAGRVDEGAERRFVKRLREDLHATLDRTQLNAAIAEGKGWSDEHARARASRV
jgi:predicted ATPase/class 3 adenylate cyclase